MGDRRRDNERNPNRDDDNNFFGMALAGLGIGAALYGVSKLFGGSSSSTVDPTVPNRSSNRGTKRPRIIEVIEMADEFTRVMNHIESDIKDYPVVGLDCEWQNNWDGTYEKTFLSNERIIKVGVGIEIDRNKLRADYNLQLDGMVDLRFIAKKYGYETRKLAYLAESIVGITLNEVDHSDWNDDPLPQDYIDYATMDVYASIEIMKKLVPSKQNVMDVCSPYINKMFTTNLNNF